MSNILMDVADDAKVKCGGCDWEGTGSQLTEITDIQERILPGEEVPAGQCPECNCLAHLVKEPEPVTSYRGVPVYVGAGSRPAFYANAGGKRHHGGSFETLRKKLDAVLVFEPFDALTLGKDVLQVRVIGVDMENSEWVLDPSAAETHGRSRWKFYNGLYPLSARDRLETHLGNCEEWTAQEEAIKEARTDDRNALKELEVERPDK